MKIVNDDGVEIEVYTADEVQAQLNPLKESLTKTESELAEAKTALSDRAGQFAQFRKLTDEALAKLSVTERALYDNQLVMEEERNKRKEEDEKRMGMMVDEVIRSKVGNDQKLFDKVKEMWGMFGVNADTPQAMEAKARMVIGAIGGVEPDMIASVAGFSNGSWAPPQEKKDDDKSFADTDQGKLGANELGLILETPKKE